MNNSPLDSAKNRDLPASFYALKRAAYRAREVAVQTGTAIVITRAGLVTAVEPAKEENRMQEFSTGYHASSAPQADKGAL